MKKICLAALVILAVGALFLSDRPRETALPPVPTPSAVSATTTTTPLVSNPAPPSNAPAPPPSLASQAGQYIPDTNTPAILPPEIVLQNLRRVVMQYGRMFGGNPVGTNPEITAALTGKNPKGINFLSGQPEIHIDANGAMIDPWGTPYFFHQLSGTEMEIHSAGPDKTMWTSDDLVTQ